MTKIYLPLPVAKVRLGELAGNEKLQKALEPTLRVRQEPVILKFPTNNGPKRAA
jgi:hypothetical protein